MLESIYITVLIIPFEIALMLLIGSGDTSIELEFTQMLSQWDCFILLKGYDKLIGEDLYQKGVLFLRSSSYQPCAINKMPALKAGQR
ncbi:MAG: hypothetical protein OFPI_25800 [Osedax symbiont Rs2]|nr:MAG: hypothetical protein OFPI_25800 [Osedax symbiont Rs2]